MQRNIPYTLGFAAVICIICSVLVSTAAVALKERQETNRVLDLRKNVLEAAGIKEPGEAISAEKVQEVFDNRIKIRLVDVKTGNYVDSLEPVEYDQEDAASDPQTSIPAPQNQAGVNRLPKVVKVYHVMDGDELEMVIFPIKGKGLWSTLRGFLALDADDWNTVIGLTYYSHGETPGLGGEVDNPVWKALWPGRKIFDETGKVAIEVIKGKAGPVDIDPYHVDGLSGATITARGVTYMLKFWMSENGYGEYINRLMEGEVS